MKDLLKDKKIVALLVVVVVVLAVVFVLPNFSSTPTEPTKISIAQKYGITNYDSYVSFIESSKLLYPKKDNLFRYNVYSDYIEISEYIGTATDVTIPSEIDDYPVLVIGPSAFSGKFLTSLTVEEGIVCIDENAFSQNVNLKTVTFNEGLLFINDSAFCGCTSLEKINAKEGILSIGSSAFENCSSLKETPYLESIQTYGDSCFAGCSSLVTVVIPPIYTIPSNFCDNCESLSAVTITALPVNETKNQTENVEEEVKIRTISGSAFSDCPALTSVWIPEDVTEIDGSAFGAITEEKRKVLIISGYSSSTAARFAAINKLDFILLNIEEFEQSAQIIKDTRYQLDAIVSKYIKQPLPNGNNKVPYIPYKDTDVFFAEVKTLSDSLKADGKIVSYSYSNDMYEAVLETGQIFTYSLNVSVIIEEGEEETKTSVKNKKSSSNKTSTTDKTSDVIEEATTNA